MKIFKYFFFTILLINLLFSCDNSNDTLDKRLVAIEAAININRSGSQDIENGMLGGKIYSIAFPAVDNGEQDASLFFINDIKGNLISIGFKTDNYGLYFETINGGIIDYPNGKDIVLTPGQETAQQAVNCRRLINRLGLTNSALVACAQAACEAAVCRNGGSCGGSSQGYLDAVTGVFCGTAKNGVVCHNCNE